MNLKDVDLKDFFRLIHEISGLNVVLDPNVKGTLTIVLDEVPWDQALDIVLQNNGLDKQLNGNVLRIATRDTLKKEAETLRDLQKAQAEAVAPVTVTRVLSYAKAATHAGHLEEVPLGARRYSLRRPFQPADHPRYSVGHSDDRQPDSPVGPQVAAGGNRSARGSSVALLQPGYRRAVGLCGHHHQRPHDLWRHPADVGVSPITTGAGLPQPPLIATPTSSSGGSTAGFPST